MIKSVVFGQFSNQNNHFQYWVFELLCEIRKDFCEKTRELKPLLKQKRKQTTEFDGK